MMKGDQMSMEQLNTAEKEADKKRNQRQEGPIQCKL